MLCFRSSGYKSIIMQSLVLLSEGETGNRTGVRWIFFVFTCYRSYHIRKDKKWSSNCTDLSSLSFMLFLCLSLFLSHIIPSIPYFFHSSVLYSFRTLYHLLVAPLDALPRSSFLPHLPERGMKETWKGRGYTTSVFCLPSFSFFQVHGC